MADPRFNFYPDNYEGGTEFFTLEQDGAYLRLLMLQFRRNQFTEKEAIAKLSQRCYDQPGKAKTLWHDLKDKFATDGTHFWSVRLRAEMDKSLQYAEGQAERAKNGWEKRKQAQSLANAEPMASHMPEECPADASNSNSISKTSSNSNSNPTKTNTADADLLALFREEVVGELNDLTGRDFDPHAKYFRRDLDARIKEYGADDLKDMIRCMVYKRKGSEWEQYLKPDTMFAAKKCGAYMDEMRQHRKNGTMPKKDNTKPGGKKLLDPMEVLSYMQQKAS